MKLSAFVSSFNCRWLNMSEIEDAVVRTELQQAKPDPDHDDDIFRANIIAVHDLVHRLRDEELSRRLTVVLEGFSLSLSLFLEEYGSDRSDTVSPSTILSGDSSLTPLTELMKSVWTRMERDDELTRDDRIAVMSNLLTLQDRLRFTDNNVVPFYSSRYNDGDRSRFSDMISDCSSSAEMYNLIGFVTELSSTGTVVMDGDQTPLDRIRISVGVPLNWIPTQGLIK